MSMLRNPVHLLALLGLALLAGYNRVAAQGGPPPDVQVVVGTPVKKQIVEWDEYVGRLEPVEFVEVRARVDGYLQAIHFEDGQIIQQGDLLAVIDPRPFVAELNRTQAELEQAGARVAQATKQLAQAEAEERRTAAALAYARTRYQRLETLVAKNAASRDEFDMQQSQVLQAQAELEAAKAQIETSQAAVVTAQAAVETAEAAVGVAQLNLEYTRVTAPVTGRVSRREVTEGNLITGGARESSLLTTIVSLDPIHVYFDADERAFLKYTRLAKEGKRYSSRDAKNPVYLALADEDDGFPHRGHMDFVDNRLDSNTGTMRGRAILANPDLTLTPGLFARVRLPGSGWYEAVLVPDAAVGSGQSEKFVLVVDRARTVRRQAVQVGPLWNGLRIVRSGLNGSEQVILRGQQRVRPGTQVVATREEIQVSAAGGLPDDYESVPKEEWLMIRRKPTTGIHPASFRKPIEAPAADSN
jgi:RND family efflux transporter MFP subunit